MRSVAVDRCGGASVSTDFGLRYYTSDACLEFAGAGGLSITELCCFAIGSEGEIWMGGYDGIIRSEEE